MESVTDDAWFEEVVRSHASEVGRALRYLGVAESELSDATQEVFLVVHRKRGDFDGRSLRAWLRAIAVQVARNQRRSQRRRREVGSETLPEPRVAPTQETRAMRRDRRQEALALLDTLSEEQRTVLVLYEVEQLTMRELTEMLGIPLQTGYSRLRLARQTLQRALAARKERGA